MKDSMIELVEPKTIITSIVDNRKWIVNYASMSYRGGNEWMEYEIELLLDPPSFMPITFIIQNENLIKHFKY